MDIINHLVLAWLEEDNQKLGHFRVRPLLRETGPFTPAEIAEWRDDGYVRVVPDKTEQRSFKERMRKLGAYCLLNLTGAQADKFKSNNKYAPSKGEKNRYIIYSNAVLPVPEGSFFEVISESAMAKAITAQVYTRQGGKIQGPVDRQTGVRQDGAHPLPPDDPHIFSVTLPDGSVRLFYWPAAEAVPAAEQEPEAAATQSEPEEAAGEEMTALDQIKALDRQMLRLVQEAENPEAAKKPQEVLIADDAGTPLYHAQIEMEAPKSRRNSLAQAVENSRRAVRAEEKPESPKKNARSQPPKKSSESENEAAAPIDEALSLAWQDAADRERLTGVILSLPGAQKLLAQAMGGTSDPVLAALKAQIQDAEAERLMTVMNLNQAKAQEAQYRESLIAGLVQSEREEIDALKAKIAETRESLDQLSEKRRSLTAELEQMARQGGLRLYSAKEAEEDPSAQTVIHRITENLKAAGFQCGFNDAAALLIAAVISGANGIRLAASCDADGKDAAMAFLAAVGGSAYAGESDSVLPGGNGLLALLMPCELGYVPLQSEPLRIYYGGASVGVIEKAVRAEVRLVQSGSIPEEPAVCPTADWLKLRQKVLDIRTPLNDQAAEIIQALRKLCAKHGLVLPLAAVRYITAFAGIAQNMMEGGIQSALDYAVLLYAVPMLPKAEKANDLKEFVRSLPLTAAALELQ